MKPEYRSQILEGLADLSYDPGEAFMHACIAVLGAAPPATSVRYCNARRTSHDPVHDQCCRCRGCLLHACRQQ